MSFLSRNCTDTNEQSVHGKLTLLLLREVATVFGTGMSYYANVNLRTQTVARCFLLQQQDINNRPEVDTLVKGVSNSFPPQVFH